MGEELYLLFALFVHSSSDFRRREAGFIVTRAVRLKVILSSTLYLPCSGYRTHSTLRLLLLVHLLLLLVHLINLHLLCNITLLGLIPLVIVFLFSRNIVKCMW